MRRAANSAASLTRLARSAPEKPGVPRARMSARTSWPTGTLRMCTLQDLLAAADVGQRHDDLAVEAARAQQRRVEHVGPVGRGDHDDAEVGLEAVHLDQQLVQRLLALVVAAAEAGAALAADRVDLVDEDDAGRVLLRLLEHVAHARRADADEHLDEVGARDREERHLGLAGDRLGEQRLAGAGRADHQHAARDAAAELLELLRVAQEVDQLLDLFLGLVAAGDVGEGDRCCWPRRACAPCVLPKLNAPPLPPPCIWRMKKIQTPISSSIGNQETKIAQQERRLFARLGVDLDAVLDQVADQAAVEVGGGGAQLLVVGRLGADLGRAAGAFLSVTLWMRLPRTSSRNSE